MKLGKKGLPDEDVAAQLQTGGAALVADRQTPAAGHRRLVDAVHGRRVHGHRALVHLRTKKTR